MTELDDETDEVDEADEVNEADQPDETDEVNEAAEADQPDLLPAFVFGEESLRDDSGHEHVPQSLGDRLVSGARLGALLAGALLIMGQLAERLRPAEHLDRGIVDTPFLWAIVIWAVTLVFHAVAFEESQLRDLEREPLVAGVVAGGLVFLVGLITADGISLARRLSFVLANSLGAVLFWWGMASLGSLLLKRVNS